MEPHARPLSDRPPRRRPGPVRDRDEERVATPDALKFIDRDALATLTGHPVRSEYKQPDEPDVLPTADAFVVAPATFNTVNKLVSGVSDTLALGLLNEAIGLGRPIIVVPAVSAALGRHPTYHASVNSLRTWGVEVMSAGPSFPWSALGAALLGKRTTT